MNATARPPVMMPPVRARVADEGAQRLRGALMLSAALHLSVLAALIVWKGMAPPARPPVYKVQLIGAAGMKQQMGIVADQPLITETASTPTKAPAAAERPPETLKPPPPKKTAARPEPKPVKATPNVSKEKPAAPKQAVKEATRPAVPVAGSGDVKARGTDVTTLVQEGIDFPYPGYVENIIRQISLEFGLQRNITLTAEFRFLIHRDGSASEITLIKGSGRSAFDLEARGAIEAVGNARKFRPLPSGFPDDVLPVFYTFAPPEKPPT